MMPNSLMRRFGGDREQISLLVKVMAWGTAILAGTYFGLLYWITRH
jgi:hypothetical protein